MKQIHECLNEKQIRKGMIVLPLRRTDYDAVCDMDKISGFGLKQCVKRYPRLQRLQLGTLPF